MYGLYYTIIRLYHLYRPVKKGFLILWSMFCAALFIAHITYLSILPYFDYGWNMKVNIIFGLAYNLFWMSYSLPSPPFRRFLSRENNRRYRPKYAWKPAALGAGMICAVGLEVFDFPPWRRVIDAHSLWHLATVPIIVGWYGFLLNDSLDTAWDYDDRKLI